MLARAVQPVQLGEGVALGRGERHPAGPFGRQRLVERGEARRGAAVEERPEIVDTGVADVRLPPPAGLRPDHDRPLTQTEARRIRGGLEHQRRPSGHVLGDPGGLRQRRQVPVGERRRPQPHAPEIALERPMALGERAEHEPPRLAAAIADRQLADRLAVDGDRGAVRRRANDEVVGPTGCEGEGQVGEVAGDAVPDRDAGPVGQQVDAQERAVRVGDREQGRPALGRNDPARREPQIDGQGFRFGPARQDQRLFVGREQRMQPEPLADRQGPRIGGRPEAIPLARNGPTRVDHHRWRQPLDLEPQPLERPARPVRFRPGRPGLLEHAGQERHTGGADRPRLCKAAGELLGPEAAPVGGVGPGRPGEAAARDREPAGPHPVRLGEVAEQRLQRFAPGRIERKGERGADQPAPVGQPNQPLGALARPERRRDHGEQEAGQRQGPRGGPVFAHDAASLGGVHPRPPLGRPKPAARSTLSLVGARSAA